MNKNDRQRLIKTRLIIDKEVSVKALAGTFSVTERTIRNDLQALADKHLCEMFYGGARLIKHDEDIYFAGRDRTLLMKFEQADRL